MNYSEKTAWLPFWAVNPICRGCAASIRLRLDGSGKAVAEIQHGEVLKYWGTSTAACPVRQAAIQGTLAEWELQHGAPIEFQVSDRYRVSKIEDGKND